MPRLTLNDHEIIIDDSQGRVIVEIREQSHRVYEASSTQLVLDAGEAVALVRALDGAIDHAVTYSYMGGRTP